MKIGNISRKINIFNIKNKNVRNKILSKKKDKSEK